MQLGKASKIVCDCAETFIYNPKGDSDRIANYKLELTDLLKASTTDSRTKLIKVMVFDIEGKVGSIQR
jgi:hypothetical protein